jgi:hypothetical protein
MPPKNKAIPCAVKKRAREPPRAAAAALTPLERRNCHLGPAPPLTRALADELFAEFNVCVDSIAASYAAEQKAADDERRRVREWVNQMMVSNRYVDDDDDDDDDGSEDDYFSYRQRRGRRRSFRR